MWKIRELAWKSIRQLLSRLESDRGAVAAEYLVLAFLLAAVGIVVVSAVRGSLVDMQNNTVNSITSITGSGY